MARMHRRPKTEITIGDRTPWGTADNVEKLGEGVYAVDTPSHGGLRIFRSAQAVLPTAVRKTFVKGGGWAEEDCEQFIAAALLHDRGVIQATRLWTPARRMYDAALRIAREHERYAPATPHLLAAKSRLRATANA